MSVVVSLDSLFDSLKKGDSIEKVTSFFGAFSHIEEGVLDNVPYKVLFYFVDSSFMLFEFYQIDGVFELSSKTKVSERKLINHIKFLSEQIFKSL